jgi:hypothetical protein
VTGEIPADERPALVRRTWELYNAGEVDAALETFAREREGIARDDAS